MKHVQCPENYGGKEKSLFLAGGITGCADWQAELINLLKDTDLVLLNPRRKHYPVGKVDLDEEQIKWEFEHFKKASAVSFWFPPETVCPITLYELGKQSALGKPIFVGVHPNYTRKKDIEIQTKLIRLEVKIVYSLGKLAEQIKKWSEVK
jgi:hypothetical protein